MLKHFIYLNESTLENYLSALEDGLRANAQTTSGESSALKGSIGVPAVSASGGKDHKTEEVASRSDTASSRFERLLRLAKSDVEASGWVEVLDPDTDFEGIGIGAIVELECEIYVPETIKVLSNSGGISQAIEKFQALTPFASALGLDTDGLPPMAQLDAAKNFTRALGSNAALVGDLDGTNWQVAGKLLDDSLRDEVEGHARVIGKVSTVVKKGTWKSLISLPGMNLISRDQRRAMERKGPSSGQEDSWIQGPALLLDILAVYR